MVKKYLITGGAGFIGGHLVKELLKSSSVTCIDNFNDYYDPKIKIKNIEEFLNNPNFSLYKIDITEKDHLEKVFNPDIDCVIHLAALAGVRPSLDKPDEYFKVNVQGTLNILEQCRINNIKKVVFASSSSVYGKRKLEPFNENMIVNQPISPYAASKATGELLCHTFSHLYDLQINCLRFFTVYGPRQRPDLAINKFTRKINADSIITMFGDGKSKRDYTFIDDIISGIIAAIDYDKTKFEIFNLGNGKGVSLINMINTIEKTLKKKAQIKVSEHQAGDLPYTLSDITKAQKLLNYNPSTSFDVGIQKFVDWYKKE